MSKKDEEIKRLQLQVMQLQYDLEIASQLHVQQAPQIPTTKKYKPLFKNDRWWSVQIELWPGAWNLHYYRYNWRKHNGRAREGQINFGPFGFSWFREPKRV